MEGVKFDLVSYLNPTVAGNTTGIKRPIGSPREAGANSRSRSVNAPGGTDGWSVATPSKGQQRGVLTPSSSYKPRQPVSSPRGITDCQIALDPTHKDKPWTYRDPGLRAAPTVTGSTNATTVAPSTGVTTPRAAHASDIGRPVSTRYSQHPHQLIDQVRWSSLRAFADDATRQHHVPRI